MNLRLPLPASLSLLVALAFFVRIIWPLSDPAAGLSWSNGVFTDPANVTYSARNAVLSGDWIRDESRDLVFFPLMNGITWLFFQAFGVGRLPTQFLAALLGAVTVGAISWAAFRAQGKNAAILTAALVGLCHWLVMFGRVPLAENLVAALLSVAAGLAMGRGVWSRFGTGALAGVAAAFGKLHAISFFPAVMLFVAVRERNARATAPVAAGLLAAALLWILLIFVPFGSRISEQLGVSGELYGRIPFLVSPLAGLAEFVNTFQNSWIFYRLPVLGTAGLFFVFGTLGFRSVREPRVEKGSALFALWFVCTWLYYTLLPYKAPRYFVLAVVPLVAGAACLIDEWSRSKKIALRPPSGPLETSVWVLGALSFGVVAVDSISHYAALSTEALVATTSPALRAFRENVDSSLWKLRPLPVYSGASLVLATGLFLSAMSIVRSKGRRPLRRRIETLSRAGSAKVVLSVAVLLNVTQLLGWASHRKYALEEAKASIDRVIGDDAVLYGAFAPALVLDMTRAGVPHFGGGSRPIPEGLGVTHVVVTSTGDPDSFEELEPALRAEIKEVQRWPLRTHYTRALRLFRIPSAAYTPTAFERGSEAMAAGRFEEALGHFGEVRTSSAQEFHDLLAYEAQCLYRTGDADGAELALQRAMHLQETNPSDYFNLGNLMLRRGNRDRAIELWRKGLALDPFDESLKNSYVRAVFGK